MLRLRKSLVLLEALRQMQLPQSMGAQGNPMMRPAAPSARPGQWQPQLAVDGTHPEDIDGNTLELRSS